MQLCNRMLKTEIGHRASTQNIYTEHLSYLSCNLLLIAGLKSPPHFFKLCLDLQGKKNPKNTTAILDRVRKRNNKSWQAEKMNAIQKNTPGRKKIISG